MSLPLLKTPTSPKESPVRPAQPPSQSPTPFARPPRQPKPPLPTLPPLPAVGPGVDPLLSLGYLWDSPERYKVARLLYMPLFRSLKVICPEIDWTKLEQWVSHYKLRRRTRDYKAYLRREDVETFIDFMLKYHPVEKANKYAAVVDEGALHHELVQYFAKWDMILAREYKRREEQGMGVDVAIASNSSGTSPGVPACSSFDPMQVVSSSGSLSLLRSSSATSVETPRVERFEIPDKRRQLIRKFVNDNIERVTRALIAIHENDRRNGMLNEFRNDHIGPTGVLLSGIPHMNPVGIPAGLPFPTMGAPVGPNIDEGTTSTSINNPSGIDADNASPGHGIRRIAGDGHVSLSNTDSTSPTGGSTTREKTKSLSPKEKEAMKAYLQNVLAREKKLSIDPEIPQPGVFYQTRMMIQPSGSNSLPRWSPQLAFDSLATPHRQQQYNTEVWQLTPGSAEQYCSPVQYFGGLHTPSHSNLLSVAQSPQSAFQGSPSVLLPPQSVIQTPVRRRTPNPIMGLLLQRGTPIGPETTPHIAMFAQQRREKEVGERSYFFRKFNMREG
ncbi:hypothetical protein ABW19_dt0204865 [Dactylella cylindrospora]|nr:hypothetical protein ABW19_dt0204865 [Dactylella cylindrospora]